MQGPAVCFFALSPSRGGLWFCLYVVSAFLLQGFNAEGWRDLGFESEFRFDW